MKQLYLIISLATLLLFSCKHELERPNWNVDMVLPIAHSILNINNLISDTSIIVNENQEGFISLIFQQEFIDMNLDTLFQIDAITDQQTHTLDSASFADVIIIDTATIGEAISNIPLLSLLLPDGSINNIPSVPSIASGDTININASEYFETMNLFRGILIITLSNGYPTDISNTNLSLVNATNQNTIANFYFPLIPSGGIVSDSVSIAGETIDENLLAVLNNMDISASNGPVLINYSDAIITTIKISDIGITEATAIFPEQQLTETFKEHTFDLGNAQINEIGIQEGTVTINVLSTLPNGKMIYNIPSLTKDGVPFTSGDIIIPQATNTDLTTFDFNFEGYVLDLTGKDGRLGGDTVNTIYTESYTFIDSTGTLETINYTDSFYSFIDFDLTPEYAKGYIGKETFLFGPEIVETDIFNFVESGNIDIENATMSIGISNYIGAEAAFQINHISVLNDNTEVTGILDNDAIYNIDRASIASNDSITPSYTEIKIDAGNMLEILPNKINTSATFYLNPNGQSEIQDFLIAKDPLEATINLEIPLRIMTDRLTFIDTTEVDLPNQDEFEIEKVYITINNGFPFDAEIQVIIIDDNNLVIDTIVHDAMITSAKVDNNIVLGSTSSIIEIDYNDFESVKRMVSFSAFTTKPTDEFISIYSSYELEITLSAKIKTSIRGK